MLTGLGAGAAVSASGGDVAEWPLAPQPEASAAASAQAQASPAFQKRVMRAAVPTGGGGRGENGAPLIRFGAGRARLEPRPRLHAPDRLAEGQPCW
jgi:hypothetical protein